ncbi:hypothetical protein [Nocardioides litoris]|uniref:hypothetical protein n=1 Tax=Nocardioides litoris TaxID=1926648 RepID=UPI001120012A|nr:hypothetical protein [Nocardioides litoris]
MARAGHTRGLRRRPRSTSRVRVRGCGGKVRFRDHEEAVEHLHHAASARQAASLVEGVVTTLHALRAYACQACHGWHVTSQPRTTEAVPA